MKELSIEEKAKRYDEALERAKEINRKDIKLDPSITTYEYIFPELKESEDEKNEKVRIGLIKAFNTVGKSEWGGLNVQDILAWLEKQGTMKEKKPKKDPCIGCYYAINHKCAIDIKGYCPREKPFDYENANIPQRDFAPKEKSKFKVGDLVVLSTSDGEKVVRIDSIEYFKSGEPMYITSEGRWFGNGTKAHLWSIKDAKDGDVLANDHNILILKELGYDWSCNGTPNSVKAYCGIKPNGNFELGKDNWSFCGTLHIHPATKEQRDTFFAKMKEAGYEWNAEKRELKKIEQKHAWNEEDEVKINRIVDCLENLNVAGNDILLKDADWLKSLKGRV